MFPSPSSRALLQNVPYKERYWSQPLIYNLQGPSLAGCSGQYTWALAWLCLYIYYWIHFFFFKLQVKLHIHFVCLHNQSIGIEMNTISYFCKPSCTPWIWVTLSSHSSRKAALFRGTKSQEEKTQLPCAATFFILNTSLGGAAAADGCEATCYAVRCA